MACAHTGCTQLVAPNSLRAQPAPVGRPTVCEAASSQPRALQGACCISGSSRGLRTRRTQRLGAWLHSVSCHYFAPLNCMRYPRVLTACERRRRGHRAHRSQQVTAFCDRWIFGSFFKNIIVIWFIFTLYFVYKFKQIDRFEGVPASPLRSMPVRAAASETVQECPMCDPNECARGL